MYDVISPKVGETSTTTKKLEKKRGAQGIRISARTRGVSSTRLLLDTRVARRSFACLVLEFTRRASSC